MSELKPCPFCGGAKICTEKSINLNYCDNCSAESNVEHWNIRPIEDDLRKRIAELEAAHVVWLAEAANEMNRLNARIAELEAAQRWIPVSERLPEVDGYYWTMDFFKQEQKYKYIQKKWYDQSGMAVEFRATHVTHWMPLPEPPIVYGKVCEE